MWVPCGKCIGCRLVRVRSWAIRCVHEAQMHEVNSFVTLTYDDDHLESPSLRYSDFQAFMRRVRKQLGPTRFFMCGEYGELNWRPHFHAILFGRTFPNDGMVGENVWRSAVLERLWPLGLSSVGNVTSQSAAYVASYSRKKVTGERAAEHYRRVCAATGEVVDLVPEFGRMSLKPGIGYSWFEKYWREVYVARDGVVSAGGRTVPPPRYYDKLLEKVDGDLREFKEFERYVRSADFAADSTPDRLLVRERCAAAKAAFLRRDL